MRKLYFFTLLFFGFNYAFAQVGINTTAPEAQLDIKASNQATPTNTDGILIPRVDAFPATAPTVSQQGMMVYLTTLSGTNPPGFYYWDNATTTWKPIAGATNAWSTTGNAGTNPATNFIGTTDANDVIFKRNNIEAGRLNTDSTSFGVNALTSNFIGSGFENSAFGFEALNFNYTGDRNSAFGYQALKNNSSGYNNSAFGNKTLSVNNPGNNNTAIGSECLSNNFTGLGDFNTVIGSLAGAILGGSSNTAVGYMTLLSNRKNGNTAIGSQAMKYNQYSADNVAVGESALLNLYSSNGSGRGQNVAIGNNSLSNAIYAHDNTAIGFNSQLHSDNSKQNTSLGFESLSGFSNFSERNTAIGAFALSNNGNNGSYNIALGYNSQVTNSSGSRQLSIGNVIFGSDMFGYSGSVFPLTSIFGLIGIGEPNPKARLHLTATSQTNPDPSDGLIIPKMNIFPTTNPTYNQDSMMVFLTTAVGVKQPGFYYWDYLTTSWKSIVENNNFWLANGTNVYKNTGNVGINTSTPSEKLEVAGNTKTTGFIMPTGAANNYVLTSNATGVATWQPNNASSFWSKSGTNVFPTSISDNIGINTTTPTSALNVNGQITIDQKNFGGYGGLLIKGDAPGNNYPNIAFSVKNTSGLDAVSGYIGGHINNNVTGSEAMDLVFLTSQNGLPGLSEKMRIKDDGNVTIAGKILNEAWQTPTLLNAWTNLGGGFNTTEYYIDKESVVHLKGIVKNGTIGTVIFSLPVGYRPTAQYVFTVISGTGFGRVDVASNGDVIVGSGNNSGVSLDGISFRVN
jgi:hypothetical protein